MHHLILRRNIKIMLLFTLVTMLSVSSLPWICRGIIERTEGLAVPEMSFRARNLPGFMGTDITGPGGGMSMDIDFLDGGYIFSRCRLNAIGLKNLMLSGDVIIKARLVRDEEGVVTGVSGRLFSGRMNLNSEMSMPIAMSFTITGGELDIKSLRLGDSYELKGKIGLVKPFESSLIFNIKRAAIKDLIMFAGLKKPMVVLGMINGSIYIKRHLGNIFSNGMLQSRNGRLGPVRYDVATLRLEGFGPIINIADSGVKYGNGMLRIDGSMDLRNIGKGALLDGIRVRSDLKTIVWEGWDINKEGTDELTMTKEINDSMRVRFKTIAGGSLTTYYDKQNPEEMSLEYRMGMEDLKMKLRNDEEFLVIEHNVRF